MAESSQIRLSPGTPTQTTVVENPDGSITTTISYTLFADTYRGSDKKKKQKKISKEVRFGDGDEVKKVGKDKSSMKKMMDKMTKKDPGGDAGAREKDACGNREEPRE